MKNIRKGRPALYREISEIYLTDEQIKIILHGRRTAFYLKADDNQMALLACAVGWLDRKGYYPEKLTISGNKALMR